MDIRRLVTSPAAPVPVGARARAASERSTPAARRAVAGLGCALAVALLLTGGAVIFTAHRAPLTSDESLYLSEGFNIARGIGPKYTSGDFVQHRPFLFPALLSIPLKLTGGDFAAVYGLTKLIAVLAALAGATLAMRLYGRAAGGATGALVLGSRFLDGLGSTLYLDGTETFFLLCCLIAIWEAHTRRHLRFWAAAGLALALAFLTKEAALLWLPLPLAFVLLTDSPDDIAQPLRGVTVCYGAFALAAGWWWPYVWIVDGRVYMWPASVPLLAAAAGAAALAVAACATGYAAVAGHSERGARLCLRCAGVLIVGSWAAAFVVVMERTSWAYPWTLSQIPAYLGHVAAGTLAPWPLTAAAVILLGTRSLRDPRARLLALGFLLWMPFAIFAARRNFAMRDLLPMVYVTYIAAGVLVVELLTWLLNLVDTRTTAAMAAAIVVVACGYLGGQQAYAVRDRSAGPTATSGDWDNVAVRSTAAWLDAHLPPGTPILSSRLYFSQLYVRADARYPIAQLPTVNVVPVPGGRPYLQVRSTLFRWEDGLLPTPADEHHWISVDAFPAKHYYTALSEDDLLHEIARRRVRYIVISGEDVAFSTTRYLDYFSDSSGYTLVHHEDAPTGSIDVFRIDALPPQAHSYRTVIPASVLNALYRAQRDRYTPHAVLDAINPDGVTVDAPDELLPELAAVIAPETPAPVVPGRLSGESDTLR